MTGSQLRWFRRKRGWSKAQIAEIFGYTEFWISDFEKSHKGPSRPLERACAQMERAEKAEKDAADLRASIARIVV